MKIFTQIEERLDKLNQILDREISNLDTIRIEHHKSWDAHILTLSTASIGFSITLLPSIAGQYKAAFGFGIIFFVLSIVSVFLGYLHSEKGQKLSMEDHIERRKLVNEATREYEALQLYLEENTPSEKMPYANEYHARAKAIFDKRDSEIFTTKIDRANFVVNFYNYSKTILFMLGLITISFSVFFSF